jgi:DNA-binding LytR/AlgR family response regulator
MPTAILADDERLMREQIRLRLQQIWPELDIVGEATNGDEAIALAQLRKPDFAFLDIRMPGKNGLEAAQVIGAQSHIVFITAYDQYAIEAFECGAVDYILKPAESERMAKAVVRLKARLNTVPSDMTVMLAQLAKQMRMSAAPAFLRWIQASIGQELRLISTDEILFFRSDEKYTCVQTAHNEALIRLSIRELSNQLDPDVFWQIHRATLVNVNAIDGVVRDLRGRLLVKIKGHSEKLEVSRSFLHLFKHM